MSKGGNESAVPQPEDIYERTKDEGRRRLERPLAEEMSTALAAGFDIVAGIIALALMSSQLEHLLGRHAAHVFGATGFGIGFVFLIVGRGELFTENFLVPIAGLDHREGASWRNLAKLWLTSPIFNVIGGLVMILIVTTHSVLPFGTGKSMIDISETLRSNGWLALFMSAIFAGALITAMTWFVEGQLSMIVRVVIGWIVGFLLALGSFNHVIVVTLELIFGYRYGAHFSWVFIVQNFFLAALGNAIGGLGLVTLNRLTQGKAGGRARAS
ncbi:MAG TPA: formate/nitrite transporter family protein [Gaiellaceae bacterium]|nr:formate/nitrite transporter family protein [Gaiellaceae bacterium]